MNALDREFWTLVVDSLVAAFTDAELRLCSYDGAIGDGDHGTSMLRGFREAGESFQDRPAADAGEVLVRIGEAFLESVGGVTGVVFGSLFDAAGRSVAGESATGKSATGKSATGKSAGGLPGTDAAALHGMFAAGLAAVKKRGNAAEGDKSMVDALSPAVSALGASAEAGETAQDALAQAARAAETGMHATIPMEAKVGRARYQSGKGRGHVDAGAASVCLIFQTLAQAAAQRLT